jgi:hypothetical protein
MAEERFLWKTLIVDGEETVCFLERGAGDGGIIVNHLVKEADGTFSNFRYWFAIPSMARAEYDALSVEDWRDRIVRARKVAAGEPLTDAAPLASERQR